MDSSKYNMPGIFAMDRLQEHLSKGYKATIHLLETDGNEFMAIEVMDGDKRVDLFRIHELNSAHDYMAWVASSFRRSKLVTDVEAYDNISITGEKLDMSYCANGMTGEASEVSQIVNRNFYFSKPLDLVRMTEEMGDTTWFQMNILHMLKLGIVDLFKTNILKLSKRYPNNHVKLEQKDQMSENQLITEYLASQWQV